MSQSEGTERFEKLVGIIARLRGPDGCPWDREQTHASLRENLLEECYEVLEALDSGDAGRLCEELGDLLLQIVLHAQIAAEAGDFELADVLGKINSKLIRRHPHIFGDVKATTPEEVRGNWEIIKQQEKGKAHSILSGTPKSMPAMLRALRISKKAASVGFDWNNSEEVLEKVREELQEVVESLSDPESVHREIGDLLFTIVNLARHLKVNPEESLTDATNKFEKRFQYVEQAYKKQNRDMRKASIEELEEVWQEAKKHGL